MDRYEIRSDYVNSIFLRSLVFMKNKKDNSWRRIIVRNKFFFIMEKFENIYRLRKII